MKSGYIISAYKLPVMLYRLVEALGDAPIAVHVDRKSDIYDEVVSKLAHKANVTFLPRHTCHWGLFGHVRASLEGMKWFMNTSCDYAILLTGQCYLLKTVPEIEAELDKLDGHSLIEHDAFPRKEWMIYENGGYDRIDRFSFFLKGRLRSLKPWQRRVPYGLHPYGGSSYWCLSRDCIEYILFYMKNKIRLKAYFSTVFASDEIFFHTILGNSQLKDRLINKQVHYVDWSKFGPNPVVLTTEDIPVIMNSGKWFARKFGDTDVLDQIDSMVNQ